MSSSNKMTIDSPAKLDSWREALLKKIDPLKKVVNVCIGTGCAAKGSRRIHELFCEAARTSEIEIEISAKCVGCHGYCENGPIIVIQPGSIFYQKVEEPDVEEIIRETLIKGEVIKRLLYKDPADDKTVEVAEKIPFYKSQQRIVLAQNGIIEPTNIDEYILSGGYSALSKALKSMQPKEIIEEVKKSGLRGRGGGGFPTGRKWESCRKAKGSIRYVICNGDEGDPGAFMDRSIMEGNPHSVIEGMIIGAYAIDSSLGYIYVRNEYPLAVQHLKQALLKAKEYGFLGNKILGSPFSFDIRINRGGGAFVCGESTALMASLEGRTGEPRAKYVHTVENGLNEKPTNLNNVETWANIPHIINKGSGWYASIGTQASKGTKVFSLVGNVLNTGLVEIPMGMTLRQIIYDIGGGIKNGKSFKAVQTGGPSGGCIPEKFLDTPVDFDELTRLGSMMGSGGMIVMDEDTCMVNVAKYFLEFLKKESCGKCTPCREGVSQMLYILERITRGEGEYDDLDTLKNLATLLEGTALCALGKTAAYPVLSTIRYFESEYKEHILDKRCPAKVCKGLFTYEIDASLCKGCRICKKNCPVDAIAGEKKVPHIIDQEKCTKCGTCFEKCPFNSIVKV